MPVAKKVLVVVTSASQVNAIRATGLCFDAFAVPYQIFTNKRFRGDGCRLLGGKAPVDPHSLSDDTPVDSAAFAKLEATVALESVNAAEFDAVFGSWWSCDSLMPFLLDPFA